MHLSFYWDALMQTCAASSVLKVQSMFSIFICQKGLRNFQKEKFLLNFKPSQVSFYSHSKETGKATSSQQLQVKHQTEIFATNSQAREKNKQTGQCTKYVKSPYQPMHTHYDVQGMFPN